ncbi:hypothetical protein Maes01_00774 [Microbulbifer aestuariivivens]|uniref:DUF11 domain-containing protein n=1 Tax=Microbulbifer aestuariivivens TaxID=1908308 RepID=A0ABP9WM95_9GAMM
MTGMTQRCIGFFRWPGALRFLAVVVVIALLAHLTLAQTNAPTETTAVQGLTCLDDRNGRGKPKCDVLEFAPPQSFSAEPGTAPFCEAGADFVFGLDMDLVFSGDPTDNKPLLNDVALFVGQVGNDPITTDKGIASCSVATFPTTSTADWLDPNSNTLTSPWFNEDTDACGDFRRGASDTVRIKQLKVLCQGDDAANGALRIPYALTFEKGGRGSDNCPSTQDVEVDECQGGTAHVDGAVAVSAGAYIDITKQTDPAGDGQVFTYTASGPAGSKVIVRNADGSFTSGINSASDQVTFTLSDGQSARVYINALSTAQTLLIAEDQTPGWDSTAQISCSSQRGTPATSINQASRAVSAQLDENNSALACTITNFKLPLLELLKQAQPEWDAINGGNNPKAIPQSHNRYTIRLSNSGGGGVDPDSLVVTDALPDEVELFVADLTAPGQGPIAFTDGSPSSALSYVFSGLASASDGVEFSQNGTDWGYVPTPDADGFDASVRHIRIRPTGNMAPASGGNASWAEFEFRVRIK